MVPQLGYVCLRAVKSAGIRRGLQEIILRGGTLESRTVGRSVRATGISRALQNLGSINQRIRKPKPMERCGEKNHHDIEAKNRRCSRDICVRPQGERTDRRLHRRLRNGGDLKDPFVELQFLKRFSPCTVNRCTRDAGLPIVVVIGSKQGDAQ